MGGFNFCLFYTIFNLNMSIIFTSQIVTWTLKSNHKSRLAQDIAVGPSQSLYDVTTLNIVGAIAKKLGIEWGGTWTNAIDRPHFEVKANWKMPKGMHQETQLYQVTAN